MKINFSIWIASRVYYGVAVNVMVEYPSILTLICDVHSKGYIQPFWFKQGVASIMFLRMRMLWNLSSKSYYQLHLILLYQIIFIKSRSIKFDVTIPCFIWESKVINLEGWSFMVHILQDGKSNNSFTFCLLHLRIYSCRRQNKFKGTFQLVPSFQMSTNDKSLEFEFLFIVSDLDGQCPIFF